MTSIPFRLTTIIFLLSANVAFSSALSINLYLSESMGESTITQLLQETKHLQNLNLMIRGMGQQDPYLSILNQPG